MTKIQFTTGGWEGPGAPGNRGVEPAVDLDLTTPTLSGSGFHASQSHWIEVIGIEVGARADPGFFAELFSAARVRKAISLFAPRKRQFDWTGILNRMSLKEKSGSDAATTS
jgi:hypothetical protein